MNGYDLSQRLMPLRGYAANCVDAADQRHHDKSHEVLWLYRLLPVIDAFIGTWAHGCELCLDFGSCSQPMLCLGASIAMNYAISAASV